MAPSVIALRKPDFREFLASFEVGVVGLVHDMDSYFFMCSSQTPCETVFPSRSARFSRSSLSLHQAHT